MSVDNFIKLNISDYTTCETYDTVCSVTGPYKVHSIVTVPVTVYSKTYRLNLRLLDASCPNLYGRDWIQTTNVSIYHIMREIIKLTTLYVMHSDHGNDMPTHSDHDNDMHTHSEHGNEMQPIVNNVMTSYVMVMVLILIAYMMLYVTMYLTLINLNRF